MGLAAPLRRQAVLDKDKLLLSSGWPYRAASARHPTQLSPTASQRPVGHGLGVTQGSLARCQTSSGQGLGSPAGEAELSCQPLSKRLPDRQ